MFIADFHIHSKYSRATSKQCVPEYLDLWARRKGLSLIGTGDFTHPAWREELKEKMEPAEEGLFRLKKEYRLPEASFEGGADPRFILSSEISSIYKKNGKVRKIHNVILLPAIEDAEKLSHRLELIGNLHSDGRPILGLDSRDLLEITLECCPSALFIPAHIWTPHFSLFGAYSGFDTIEECFEDLTPHIAALETGLSSDPPMNWRLSALDRFTLVSNSDSHSPSKLAREANLFHTDLSYSAIQRALKDPKNNGFGGTIEFFPEEGKYHYDGHRPCKVCLKPSETISANGRCPVCGRRITVGVLHRVEELADRPENFVLPDAMPFESLVPLPEVIAASLGCTPASVKVERQYESILHQIGSELFILREAPIEDIQHHAGRCIAEGIRRLRAGEVDLNPGYDGEYGKIKLFDEKELEWMAGQICLFGDEVVPVLKKKASSKKKTDSSSVAVQEVQREEPSKPSADTHYGLNEQQWEASSVSKGTVAVVAGPGTGKTRTLVYRIAYLVEQCGVKPSQITAVTFTNKAANEMRQRLEEHFQNKRTVRSMNIGTFHSICLNMLSKWRESVSIIDQYEALSIVEDLISQQGSKLSPRDALESISKIKSGMMDREESSLAASLCDAYCARLQQANALDYDDILLQVLEHFKSLEKPDQKLLKPFTHLLVDEFQDINPIQYELIQKWSVMSHSLFVIGDPDQAIYGFRGSDAHCFDRFREQYPDLKSVRLIQNYRSTPDILGCALPVIAQGEDPKLDHALEAMRPQGEKVRLMNAKDPMTEAIFVAKEIGRLMGGIDMLDAHNTQTIPQREDGKPLGFSDMAILYRTHRQAEILEQCLIKEGIPYTVAGRESFLTDASVQNTLSFFRFLQNPSDLLSLSVCLKGFSLPKDRIQSIQAQYETSEHNIGSLCSILQNASLEENSKDFLLRMLQTYEPLCAKGKPARLLGQWISDNGLSQSEPMEKLLNVAVMHSDLSSFLQNLALGKEADVVRSSGHAYHSDAVTLMTLHGSKGLEFPVVFLCGANEKTIPLQSPRRPCDLEEECRLFYVGMTRAQDILYLMTSPAPSPFLRYIPKGNILDQNTLPPSLPKVKQFSLFDL
nr:UvrD-helicase domain-containing protein [uncultured Solibaculum sp.]